MSAFRVRIETDNAAFQDHEPGAELARILRELADELEAYGARPLRVARRLRDVNGNTVGEATWTGGAR